MPVPVAPAEVEAARQAVAATLCPAEAMTASRELFRTIRIFGSPDHWQEDMAEAYLEAFADVPEDLLLKACRHVRLSCKFFPRPAEFREPIRDELARRKVALAKLEMMAARASAVPPPVVREQDPARRAEIADQAVATVRAAARTVVLSTSSPADDVEARTNAETLKRTTAGLASFHLADISEAEAEEMLRRWPAGGGKGASR